MLAIMRLRTKQQSGAGNTLQDYRVRPDVALDDVGIEFDQLVDQEALKDFAPDCGGADVVGRTVCHRFVDQISPNSVHFRLGA